MSIQGIESVVQQLQSVALQSTGSTSNAIAEQQSGFADEMKSALGKISEQQTTARAQAQKFELGEEGVALNDVMVDLQKASISMQMGIQVRNKLVSAYQEIMNMSV
ncbi:flagellar hook-basal body complex protein FliE [Lonsdalea britannica]|uniref:Flagellar hook-basal body complex protein FliE n=1 Tax=Lonsdalea britannica TaxID=1082704 RepID=A0AAD0WL90_9GAMM|nr:flagellar hook-basal body complex protein FliE [Lonsdalea britannica]AXW87619.1 flagellar hook-basal body complex protein FliE [Lonsdalea britannica]OSM96723.1 flagellar hook-basal body complex protein FliE [Lonsdalea britannica]